MLLKFLLFLFTILLDSSLNATAYYQTPSIVNRRISPLLNTNIKDFESWWPKAGIKGIDKVCHSTFSLFSKSSRGLAAQLKLSANEQVIVLPVESVLKASSKDLIDCPEESLQSLWTNIPYTSRVSILLLKEWEKGINSKFSPYINALPLPSTLSSPLHWPEEFLQIFPYEPIIKNTTIQKRKWKNLYNELLKTKSFTISYERFIWAMEMVMSRAFQGIGGLDDNQTIKKWGLLSGGLLLAAIITAVTATSTDGQTISGVLGTAAMLSLLPATQQQTSSSCVLLPAIDSCNHSGSYPNCELALEPSAGGFVLRTKVDIKEGDQLTISYGERSNDYLLQYFGFVEENNAFDTYIISSPLKKLQELLLNEAITSTSSSSSKSILSNIESLLLSNKFQDEDVILSKKGKEFWKLGSLICVKEQEILPVNAFEEVKVEESDENLVNSCLKRIVNNEYKNIDKFLKNDIVISNNNVGNQNEDNLLVAKKFLEQKLDILAFTLSQI
eukprot:gene10430-21761_t